MPTSRWYLNDTRECPGNETRGQWMNGDMDPVLAPGSTFPSNPPHGLLIITAELSFLDFSLPLVCRHDLRKLFFLLYTWGLSISLNRKGFHSFCPTPLAPFPWLSGLWNMPTCAQETEECGSWIWVASPCPWGHGRDLHTGRDCLLLGLHHPGHPAQ